MMKINFFKNSVTTNEVISFMRCGFYFLFFLFMLMLQVFILLFAP